MLYSDVIDYWLAITQIESEEILLNINVCNFSNMEKRHRESFFNDINKNTRSIVEVEPAKVLTSDMAAEEVMKVLSGRR